MLISPPQEKIPRALPSHVQYHSAANNLAFQRKGSGGAHSVEDDRKTTNEQQVMQAMMAKHLNSPNHPAFATQQIIQRMADPVDKPAALAQHQIDQHRVYTMINNAAAAVLPERGKPSRAKLLKNTAELIRANFETLIVMTRTHADPALRAPGEVGYFDLAVRYPHVGGDYNLAQDHHIYMAPERIQGHADHRGEIRLYDPSDINDEDLKTVLIHETQHQADFHNPGQEFAENSVGAHNNAQAVNGYKTEFRAYWIGGLFRVNHHGAAIDRLGFESMPADNQRKVPSGSLLKRDFTTNFQNMRQEKIFWHLIDSGSYGYILTAYQESPEFREMVDRFTVPKGGNLLNSARIDALRLAIRTLGMRIEAEHDHIRNQANIPSNVAYQVRLIELRNQVKAAMGRMDAARARLDDSDVDFLLDESQSAPFWHFAQVKLGGIMAQELHQAIHTGKIMKRRAELQL